MFKKSSKRLFNWESLNLDGNILRQCKFNVVKNMIPGGTVRPQWELEFSLRIFKRYTSSHLLLITAKDLKCHSYICTMFN